MLRRFHPGLYGWALGLMALAGPVPALALAARAAEPALQAASDATGLEPGAVAPDFTLPDQDGKLHHLAELRGKTVVLAFYPKDLTAG